MSLRVWSWLSGIVAALSLSIPAAYTWFVVAEAPAEVWGWGHQFVATFFSVGFTAAVAVWLYTWQTRRAISDRKRDLRAMLLTAVFDIRDLVNDDNLRTVRLPDGSEEKVLLTFLQPTIFEEAMRSGLFGASETLILSRMAALTQVYNGKATRFLEGYSAIKARSDDSVEGAVIEELRSQLYAVQEDVQEIVTGCENLMKTWSFKEFEGALAGAKPEDDPDEVDPRVEQILRQVRLRVAPPGYKAGLYAKLWEIEDKVESGDHEAAHALVDDLVKEVHAMPEDRITAKEASTLIATVDGLKKTLGDLDRRTAPNPED